MASLRLDQLITRHVGPIELRVGAGECVCVQGASGSGKTLLLRAIADLDPHRGESYLDAQPCSSLPAPDWRRSVALVVAESQWWSERVGDHFDHDPDAAWMEQLGLPDEAVDWRVSRCSTGERQRLALLRTLMQSPGALLLDEPTGNLDQDSTRRVEALLADYRQQRGAALLWVSHDPGQIDRVAQRNFILREGKLEEGSCP
ncbi:ATP-binding cassette domain-containing protein [Accumulibacter sp.]|uniref:ABC transporter ATP-binding protein n=1 Tax=Accumulibacter sp. TaxID=2053492 RepID=UPI001DDAD520|nr:ATP-binding cassette domain-containing protein [Accumulibacter sp.]MCB1965116.1 ATP-binding cassette domain-containing protein [Accumulibacter sp.]MCP5228950.1 ATP-binding cassette domain-containing protein [Accumulibacter sp.]